MHPTPRPPRLALLLVLALLPVAGPPVRAADQTDAGVVNLFNGRNLDGWVIEHGGQFSVSQGVITVNRGTGWLRSVGTFADFVLVMEFRFLESRANGGIFVRTAATSHEDETGWPNNGYQVQCMDTVEGDHPLATLLNYGAPEFEARWDVDALRRAYRPVGEWHSIAITCRGETMQVVLNGETITTATNIKNLTGHIGIQAERGLLEFRKVQVRKL